jgi:hypothetical protein
MLELVRRARRRLLNFELLAQGANAFSAAFGALILLLIFGTRILEWYWVAALPLVAAGIGVYLAVKRVPSPYRTAQLVDHRAELVDTLSTALYFSDKKELASPEVLRWQQHRAEEAAGTVDLARALPYMMPRTAYALAALALVASSLFALRYGFSRSLDLGPPLARVIGDQFSPEDKKEVAENRHRRTPKGRDDTDTKDDAANQDQKQQGQDEQNADQPSDEGDSQNAEKSGESKDQTPKKDGGGDQNQDGKSGQDQQADSRDQQKDSGEQGSANQGDNKGESKQQSDGRQNNNNAGDSGSLLSKMKDFAENLLSKMKPQSQNNGTPPTPQQQNQNAKQGQGQGQKGQQQNSKDNQQNQGDQADSQQAQGGDKSDGQESQGKGNGDKSQQNKQPGSGIGSEDGDKSIKRAEQLAAMGKITELIGKRSATVTGESTVEVQNTSQQLHTAYVQRGAQHSQAGAQIDRDEVPVALQPFVEQYFDQVRKSPAAVTPVAPKKQPQQQN